MKKYFFYILVTLFMVLQTTNYVLGEEFEIKHADSLEADEEEINVQGNILIKYKDAVIEAPHGKISTDAKGKPEKAIFYDRAKIQLKDRKLEANKIIVSINSETIYAEGNTLSELKDKNNNPIIIKSDYQELNWNGENASAKGNITTTYEDTKVISDKVQIIYKNKRPYQAIFTGGKKQSFLEQQNHRTFANEFTFDISTKDTYARDNVTSTIWPYKIKQRNEQNPILLNTDELYINHTNGVITAKGKENKVKISYEETKGESKEALLLRDSENKNPEKIVFKGDADVSQADKKLSSEEVIFNFSDKKLTSNTITNIRPKTLIFKNE